MKYFLVYFFILLFSTTTFCQFIPNNTNYNQDIVWENVFTNGPSGKVNRGIVDSDGNCAVIFMPPNMSRVHKIDGNDGSLLGQGWIFFSKQAAATEHISTYPHMSVGIDGALPKFSW